MLVTDTVSISEPRYTRQGYMVVDAAVARIGIQVYSGIEMGWPEVATVRVYRPEAEVFHHDAMTSFCHRPVTLDHPAELVTSHTWKRDAVGQTGDEVARDGDHLRVPFTLMDQATIDAVKSGKRELSCGYVCAIDRTPGVTDSGEPYDAVQRRIVGDHLAIVDRGRAGSSCRIGDAWPTSQPPKGAPSMAETMRTVNLDGFTIQTTDQGAQAIDKLQQQLTDTARAVQAKEGQIAALTAGHVSALAAKDGELAALRETQGVALTAKDGEIAALKAQIPDAAAMDAAIEARTGVIAFAKRVLGDGFDPKGKSDADIRHAVVAKRLGDAQVAGKPPEYVAAAFDTLALSDFGPARPNGLRDAIRDQRPQPTATGDAADAHAGYVRSLTDGWRSPAQKETV